MSANTEKCSETDKTYCEYNEFRRLRYFHGMLLDDKDFRAEQQYHAGKRRFLNRMLHGWGVVCGLELRSEKDKRWIQITPGLALDCSGNEIWLPKGLKIDLATLLPPKQKPKGSPDCKPVDNGDNLKTYYIGIRYEEKPSNPVSVYLPSGNCEERTCENSRWVEGYCVEIVECCNEPEKPGLIPAYCACKDGYKGSSKDLCAKCGKKPDGSVDVRAYGTNLSDPADWCRCMVLEEFCEQSVPCGECCSCEKPCHVILGQIKVDEKCLVQQLCMNECRRYVLTGPLVQNLLVRVLSGAEQYFKFGNDNLPKPIQEYIYNPIKALCWWLPKQLEGREWKWLTCNGKEPEDTPKPEVLLARVQQLSVKQEEVRAQLHQVTQENLRLQKWLARLDPEGKLGAPEDQPPAEKQQKPSKK